MTAVLEPVAPLLGSTTPRLGTPPLVDGPPGPCGCGCALTPASSLGFEAEAFAIQVLSIALLPWQRHWLIHALELRPDGGYRFRTVLTLVGRQNGKALDVDTPMLTTAGWSTMGALREGDEVYHPDGHPTRVVGAYDTMHGHGCYRVTTTDGRSIVADADHLWTVQDVRRRTSTGPRGAAVRGRTWETLTTTQLVARGVTRGERECAYRLPVQHAVTSKPADLPIDPYLLGAWLGDGASTSAQLTVGDQDLVETIEHVEATGARIVSRRRYRTAWAVGFSLTAVQRREGFGTRARALGVWGDKHIPDAYLTAGTEQRLALLQGLMDTDGSISVAGQAEFCATRRVLAEGVLYLARSLGWRATMRESAATLGWREVGRRWRVCFTPEQGEAVPFRLRRKVARVKAPSSRGGERHAVSIAAIEPVESRPVRCIKVDREDGLFLAGRDLMPTHNTTLCKVLALWAMYLGHARMVLGAAQSLDIAREAWAGAVELAEDVPDLADEIAPNGIRRANGEQCLTLSSGARYRIAAATRGAGRGLSVDLLVLDELREQRNTDAWAALSKTTMARPRALIVGISNAGDDESVVLNALRSAALAGADDTIGLFEWSAPDGCELDDMYAVAQACPGLGRTITESAVRSALATDTPAVFRTEILCQHVEALDAAVDPAGWEACADRTGSLESVRERLVLCVDVAPDGRHVTLVGSAPLDDGRVRSEVMGAWTSTEDARAGTPTSPSLLSIIAKLRPRAVGYFPSGPGAVFGVDLAEQHGTTIGQLTLRKDAFQPYAPGLVELTGTTVPELCQTAADLVQSRQALHPDDPLLNAHVAGSQRHRLGDGWRFARKGVGHVDAAYAWAGSVHLARSLPLPAPPPRSQVF